MPRIHPKTEVFDGLRNVFPEEAERLLRRPSHAPGSRKAKKDGSRVLSWRSTGSEYDQVVDGVLDRFRPRLEMAVREMAEAPRLLSELLAHPSEQWEEMARGNGRFQSLAFCRLVLDQSFQESGETPVRGERLATFALTLLDGLDRGQYGDRVLADARARAWIAIANARRISEDLWGAEAAFRTAGEHLRRGMRDCLEKAQFLRYKACLRRAQCRFPEAASLFRRSISIFLALGEERCAAQTIVAFAILEQFRGEPEKAIHLLDRAARLVHPDEDSYLHGCICFNRISCLVEAGRILEAQALLARRPRIFQAPDERIQLHARWLKARIVLAGGHDTEAAALLDQVRKGFAKREHGYLAALVSLELAAVHAGLGHVAAAGRLAREAQPIFQSLGIVREALAASIVYRQAAAADQRRAKA